MGKFNCNERNNIERKGCAAVAGRNSDCSPTVDVMSCKVLLDMRPVHPYLSEKKNEKLQKNGFKNFR